MPLTQTGLELSRWMGQVPEEASRARSLSEFAIPGAHNAGASGVLCLQADKSLGEAVGRSWILAALAQPVTSVVAVCQDQTITGLLTGGIRALDLRVGDHDGVVHICHTVVCATTLEAALREVAEFLAAARTEVVSVTIRRDYKSVLKDWAAVQGIVGSVFGSLGLHLPGEECLSLPFSDLIAKDWRAVVMVEAPPECAVTAGFRLTPENCTKSWRNNTRTVKHMNGVLCEWRATGLDVPERGRLKFLEVALPVTPRWHAPGAMAAFRGFLQGGPMRIGALMDFPDARTVRAVVAKNWEDLG